MSLANALILSKPIYVLRSFSHGYETEILPIGAGMRVSGQKKPTVGTTQRPGRMERNTQNNYNELDN